MTRTQQEIARVTDAKAARALRQNVNFLGRFMAPRSPSEVAPEVGMAANLTHHHARKLADLGLLFEARREGGRVLYQLAAREFRVPWEVVPPVDETGGEKLMFQQLTASFWQAYERSWRQTGAGEEAVFGFGDATRPVPPSPTPDAPAAESHPTHLESLTLNLTSERCRRLVRAISALLDEAAAEGIREDGKPCTVAVLGFQGVVDAETETFRGISRRTSSFLGALTS